GELAAELTDPNVTVTGWLNEGAVQRALSSLDLYTSTSLWEGLSLGVLRAMAAGKPLVLRRCPGNVDAVRPGENGYLFESAEEAVARLTTLARDPDLRRRMGECSRSLFAERFT